MLKLCDTNCTTMLKTKETLIERDLKKNNCFKEMEKLMKNRKYDFWSTDLGCFFQNIFRIFCVNNFYFVYSKIVKTKISNRVRYYRLIPLCYECFLTNYLDIFPNNTLHKNKNALSVFYRKKYFFLSKIFFIIKWT